MADEVDEAWADAWPFLAALENFSTLPASNVGAMATLSFEADSHDELVRQVRTWLGSMAPGPRAEPSAADPTAASTTAAETIDRGADLTREALRVIAEAAPDQVSESELFQSLGDLGIRLTETARTTLKSGLEDMESATDGSVVNRVADVGRSAAYEMNTAVAKEFLRRWANS